MPALGKAAARLNVPIDFREHIDNLREAGLLHQVDAPISKETKAHPLVRLQFRGLKEERRKGFLFTQVHDAQGKRYDTRLAISCLVFNCKLNR